MLEFNSKSDLLFACFNEYVYKDAKLNIDALKSYYKSNFSINNELHNRLLSIIETSRRYEDITEATFDMMLDGLNLTTKEIDSIKASIKSYSGYTSDQMAPVRERLKSVCYQAIVNDATRSSGDDPVGFVTKLKDFTYRSTGGGRLQMKKFGDLDVKSESDNYSAEGVIKSSFRFINDSYSNGGYIRGQIVVVCAPPGCGKSLFVEQEAVNFAKQGKKVHMMVLGDLHEIDIAIRLTCMALNKRKREVESDIIAYFEKAKSVINDNICITCVPAGVVSGREYVDWMLTDGKEFDVLMADYDANFRKDYSNSMYDEYGQLYDSFTELTDAGKLLFVCTQPKIGYWGNEVIELEGFGESSRKQQIADMGITIGRRSSSPNRVGKMKIVKGRKCDAGAVANWIGTTEGLFYECDDVMYSIAIANTQKFYKTYAQLASEDENGVLNSLFSMTVDKDISTTPNEVPGVSTPKVGLASSSQGITNRAKDRLSGLGMEPPGSVGTQFVEFPGGVPF